MKKARKKARKKPPEKKAMGRPTKYDPDYCEEIVKFFDIEPITIKVQDGIQFKTPAKFPTFERFAYTIGVHRDTLHEWVKNYPDFSDAYKKAHELQFAVYQEGVMMNAWNSTFAIFLGKNIFGLVDKKEIALDANVREIVVIPPMLDDDED